MAEDVGSISGAVERPMFMGEISSESLDALSSAQKRFIVSLRSVSPDLCSETLRKYVAELIPSAPSLQEKNATIQLFV